MAPPPPHDLLDFYVVEATEYIDRIDGLVTRAGSGAPDGQSLVSAARALRGSSTMAKAEGMATVALAVEQVARGVRDATIAWTPLIQGALVSAVDDLRILLRNLRVWGPNEQTRATFRVEELRELVPGDHGLGGRLTPTPAAGTATPVFISLQASAIASALEQYLKNPGERHALDDALARVRTLRGIAAVSELPPLGDVADLVERAIVALPAGARPNAQQKELLVAAASVLTRAADELRTLGKPAVSTPELARFAAAAALTAGAEAPADAIVPIEQLYFSDAGPHVVQRGTASSASPAERFRKETVSRSEHLARLVAEARAATTDVGRERAERELRNTLRQLEQTAAALGERAAEAFFGEAAMAPAILSPKRLGALEAAAQLLLAPANGELGQALASLTRSLTTPPSTPAAAPLRAPPLPVAAPPAPLTQPAARMPTPPHVVAPRRASITPTGTELRALLQTGIAGFQPLTQVPLSEPASIGDDDIVPIESLLYRGRAALDRAIAVRDELQRVRASGGTPDDTTLAELFDLLELARRE